MATFQLFFQSGRANDLSEPLYFSLKFGASVGYQYLKMASKANTRRVMNVYLSKSQFCDVAHMTLDILLPIFCRTTMTVSSDDNILRAVKTDYTEEQ